MVKHPTSPNSTPYFERLWGMQQTLKQKLDARFQTHPNPETASLHHYTSIDGASYGSLNTFSGSEIDWLVHAWLQSPSVQFCNMHLTVWLGPQIRVPHFGCAFATMPHLFFYIDYIPRADLMTDLTYLDRYYEPVNAAYLALQADERLKSFISKTLYIRQVQSQTSLCFTGAINDDTLTLLNDVAHEMMDRWLTWVDEAEAVPEAEQVELAERDLIVRQAIAERDPDNALAQKFFGAELTDQLVRGLWGGDRTKP